MVHDDAAVGLDGLEVVFDDERVVSDAGIALAGWCACVEIGRALRTPGGR